MWTLNQIHHHFQPVNSCTISVIPNLWCMYKTKTQSAITNGCYTRLIHQIRHKPLSQGSKTGYPWSETWSTLIAVHRMILLTIYNWAKQNLNLHVTYVIFESRHMGQNDFFSRPWSLCSCITIYCICWWQVLDFRLQTASTTCPLTSTRQKNAKRGIWEVGREVNMVCYHSLCKEWWIS